ncbi:NTF2 domain-containing protein (plasmid) [Rhizobium etli bv. mimosae str. IE4771]|uniref:NTF2 domain-containing protein n=2 Tax=Rhizobium etli TaxID=29449 RepID=A0A060ICI1_RHIET|nr:NTF2 domain-containing protein [Rhizobium sp. IE4771]
MPNFKNRRFSLALAVATAGAVSTVAAFAAPAAVAQEYKADESNNVGIVADFLNNTAADKVEAAAKRLVAPDATYISLNFDNSELKQIIPWVGTEKGPEAYSSAIIRVQQFGALEDFKVVDIFGAGENVAVFGQFTYRAKATGIAVTSPLAIRVKVRDGKIILFQFMEDSYGTASAFRVSGKWTVKTDPAGSPYEVGKSN